MPTLNWGLDDETIKERWPGTHFYGKFMTMGCLSVTNFPGDCGSLLISNVNSASEQSFKMVEEYASLSGFSKLFATIVTHRKHADNQLAKMKALGWRCVSVGNSNRNPGKRDYVMFKRINCKYKGY